MKYMVAVDRSENSKQAFLKATAYAKEDDHIFVLAVCQLASTLACTTGSMTPYVNFEAISHLDEKIEQETKDFLNTCGNYLTQRKIPHTLLLAKGDPKEMITKEAEEKEIDILFVGRRGMGAIERLIMGSVSSHLVSNCPSSVFVVKHIAGHPSIF
eukprot:TRINITY_DN7441_c0_g1_i6.p1 TRINITY_DN7441_c0_g1~~TRINITY_DN7441_c0_g1_i6.p1  ORF type:complete len:156 (-),score=31.20 TRINITY_DN7441_c0_g1_i6:98-565(-)